MVDAAKGGQGAGVIDRIEAHHQERPPLRNYGPLGEVEINRVAQMPDIGRVGWVVKRHWDSRDIAQLDKLIAHIIAGRKIHWMVHDFADHDWTDARIRVGSAGALPKFGDTRRVINAEGARAHG